MQITRLIDSKFPVRNQLTLGPVGGVAMGGLGPDSGVANGRRVGTVPATGTPVPPTYDAPNGYSV